mmetsp:Transcript_60319/g.197364  ORF Transcript_60319/g.197364 Transcript_60319/m.197364 type:complete len:252 (-) Transcript_60319:775-1530(-)
MASSALAAGMAIGTVDFASKDSAVDAVKTTMSRMICEEEQSIQALEDLLKEIQAMKHADPSSASFGEASTPSNFDEMSDTEEVDSVEQREQQLLAAQSRQQELETHARELWRQLEHVEDVLRASEESLEQAGVDRDIAEARAHAYREEAMRTSRARSRQQNRCSGRARLEGRRGSRHRGSNIQRTHPQHATADRCTAGEVAGVAAGGAALGRARRLAPDASDGVEAALGLGPGGPDAAEGDDENTFGRFQD